MCAANISPYHHMTIHTPSHMYTNSPTITPPSLSYFLFPSCFSMLSLSLEKLLTCGVYLTPPSLSYFLFPYCFSMLSLSLEKLLTCGVIRSYNFNHKTPINNFKSYILYIPLAELYTTFTGLWYTYPSEKWWISPVGSLIPNWMEKIKAMFQTTNQFMYALIHSPEDTWTPGDEFTMKSASKTPTVSIRFPYGNGSIPKHTYIILMFIRFRISIPKHTYIPFLGWKTSINPSYGLMWTS